MSFLDLDERLIELASLADLVYSPLLDVKEYPNDVDVVLVEGAVANQDHWELIHVVREKSRLLVCFGDCAVTGNVTALRNPLGPPGPLLDACYLRGEPRPSASPSDRSVVPELLDRVRPVHQVVHADYFLPGCPPSADLIFEVAAALLAGRVPEIAGRCAFG
jgi:NAD-reducing hydrogenase small subunit